MPRSGSSEALRREVGAGWVHLFDGALTGADVERAVAAARSGRRTAAPDLRDRDWDLVGRRHRAAYLTALGRQP
jgi:beta-1,4-mannosyltransferase